MNLPLGHTPDGTAHVLRNNQRTQFAAGKSVLYRTFAKYLLLPGLTGILAFAAFPKVDQGYLAWIAFTPLVLHIARCETAGQAFLGGFVAGAVQMGGLLIWVPAVMMNYGGVPRVGAYLLYALLGALQASYPAVSCSITRFMMNRRGERFLLAFPFVWLSLEFLETHFPFGGFPWLLVGYSQTSYPTLVQVADLTSVYGVSFLIVCANTALAWIVLRRARGEVSLRPLIVVFLLVGLTLIYGQVSLARWNKAPTGYSVAMLQQNISIDEPEAEMESKFREGYLRMADRLELDKVDLLILPESPAPASFQYDERYRTALEQLSRRFSLGIIFNNIAYQEAAGVSRYFNSAYFLDRRGTERGRYDKIHLVPFGEYVPMKRLFFFVQAISKDVSDFQPGSQYTILPVGEQRAAAIICFEAVFPQLARRFVRGGAELLVNLTNDGWYGDSSAPYQHLAMSQWRAVENRRYLLRANNSGISAVIAPSGRIQAHSGLHDVEICRGQFDFISSQSIYSRCGDVFVFVCVIITLGLLAFCMVRMREKHRHV